MRLLVLGAGLGAILLSVATASAQIPQTQGSNILITRCDAKPYYASEPAFHDSPYKSGERATLTLGYQNEAPSVATEVVFGLVSDGKLVTWTEDTGKFTTGATINRDAMMLSQAIPERSETHCVVLGVRYANGVVWRNPAPPPLARNP
jgi:hypothetical protein